MIKEKEEFEKIYYETYDITLKYIVCNSSNINDVNDIIQEVYLEVYKKLNKMDYINDINSYIIGIAKNKIRKHYYKFNRLKTLSIFNKNDDEIEYVDIIKSDIDLEKIIINSNLYEKAWDYVKTKKYIIAKVFFLYLLLLMYKSQTFLKFSKYVPLISAGASFHPSSLPS